MRNMSLRKLQERKRIMEDNKNPMEEELNAEQAAEETSETAENSNEATESAETSCGDEKACKGEKKKLKKAEAELNELKKTLEKKDVELAEANDKYLRLCAEYDNFRKRTAKERESIYADAVCEALTQILPVLDNLERAAQYNTEDMAETQMGKGLELTLKSFVETLGKLGVAEIEAEGKPFDPNLHNAVMHVEDEMLGENEVAEVFMKGYAKGDKVLRHSMVKVAN